MVLELFTDGDGITDDTSGDEGGNAEAELSFKLARGSVVENVVGNVVGNPEPLVLEGVDNGAIEESPSGTVLLALGDEVGSPLE